MYNQTQVTTHCKFKYALLVARAPARTKVLHLVSKTIGGVSNRNHWHEQGTPAKIKRKSTKVTFACDDAKTFLIKNYTKLKDVVLISDMLLDAHEGKASIKNSNQLNRAAWNLQAWFIMVKWFTMCIITTRTITLKINTCRPQMHPFQIFRHICKNIYNIT